MVARNTDDVLATVLDFALALDHDDFERVAAHLAKDVTYIIDDVTHRGPEAVVESYRQGSAAARRVFDDVDFSHSIVWHKGDTVRVDFSDRLTADGDTFQHHSMQDITVDRDRCVTVIVDQPIDGQRARLDEFMTSHNRIR
jgi:ketosteroid isomerase-like protein